MKENDMEVPKIGLCCFFHPSHCILRCVLVGRRVERKGNKHKSGSKISWLSEKHREDGGVLSFYLIHFVLVPRHHTAAALLSSRLLLLFLRQAVRYSFIFVTCIAHKRRPLEGRQLGLAMRTGLFYLPSYLLGASVLLPALSAPWLLLTTCLHYLIIITFLPSPSTLHFTSPLITRTPPACFSKADFPLHQPVSSTPTHSFIPSLLTLTLRLSSTPAVRPPPPPSPPPSAAPSPSPPWCTWRQTHPPPAGPRWCPSSGSRRP